MTQSRKTGQEAQVLLWLTKREHQQAGYNRFLELGNDVKVVIFTEKRIEAHVCICFVAYKGYKELERLLKINNISMSVDKVLDIAKTETTVKIKSFNSVVPLSLMIFSFK